MDGDLGPLPELADVAEAHDALLMVDDAHGEGVLGSHGRGIVDHFNVHGRVDIEMGTMSKALGVVGGYIAGKKVIVDYLRQRSRAFKFTTGSTPMDAAACMAAVKLLESSDELVKRLWENTDYFKNEMKSLGIDTGKTETPITPVMLGDEKLASEFSKRMLGEDIYVQAIKYPTVPMGTARLRVMISAAHSREDLDFAVTAIKKVGKELAVIQ
jgi:glycine C-acetyltransferase